MGMFVYHRSGYFLFSFLFMCFVYDMLKGFRKVKLVFKFIKFAVRVDSKLVLIFSSGTNLPSNACTREYEGGTRTWPPAGVICPALPGPKTEG